MVDPFLQSLIRVVNRVDVEVPVTLAVQGLLISGMLCSALKYSEAFSDSWGPELLSIFGDQGAELYRKSMTQGLNAMSNQSESTEGYIHLKQVQYRAGTASVESPAGPLPGHLWRGRLTDVSGFSLGLLSSET